MKTFLLSTAIAAALTISVAHAADVGVSVSIGQPGFYGQIDIGDYPRPRVLYSQPRIIERVVVEREPVYMRVPPGHAKHWDKHCREYNACDRRVYFVQDDWYNREYAPRYQERHREHHDDHRDGDRDHRDDHHDDRHDDHHGRDNH